MNKILQKMGRQRRGNVQGMQDQGQEQVLALNDQMVRYQRLQALPKSPLVENQMKDIETQIQKTLSLLGKTGHSYDAGVAKQDAVIRQAKYIKAMDVVKESNLKKVIDVINSQQVKDTEVSEDIERMAREEIENIMNNPRPDSQVHKNIQALMRDIQRAHGEDVIANRDDDALDKYDDWTKDRANEQQLEYQEKSQPLPQKSEESEVLKHVHHVKPVEEMVEKEHQTQIIAEKMPNRNLLEEGEMKAYLADEGYLNKNGKLKSKQMHSFVKKKLTQAEHDKGKKKLIKDILEKFKK